MESTLKDITVAGGVEDMYGEDRATEDQLVTPWTISVASGYSLLRDPHHNKGLAFTEKERDAHYLRGLLPPVTMSQKLQEKKLMDNIRQYQVPLQKYMAMMDLESELENLSFMYSNAQDYAKAKRRVAELYKKHEKELIEANKILMKKIEDDQFLDLMALKTEVRSACKEPYRSSKATDVMKPIYGSTVPVLKGEKFSMRILMYVCAPVQGM